MKRDKKMAGRERSEDELKIFKRDETGEDLA